ncbi:hypothetical protein GFY24_37110 [Nocardia sp. SYP-A9097]|uniref:hypothetical protein n=1 Tax=Nocardia sp. SYP-A9097 TaxID=2663237 RepID=UPI00129A3FE9|nr:hypothetical protein [Nocardia sp. SYP-A9097]MRH92976.1 hypothetical protein [Nocardia sp. SYP-A9097]
MSFLGGVFGSARKRFGEKVLAQVLGYEGIEAAEFDADAFEVRFRFRESGHGKLVLDTLFKRCQGQPDTERERRVDDLMRDFAADGEPDTWDAVVGRLRPVLRGSERMYIDLEGFEGRNVMLWRSALPYLIEMVVVDMPSTIQFVNTLDLERWGVDAEQVFRAAHVNMAGLAMNTLQAFEPPSGTKVLEFADDDGESYVGSLPLIAGWLAGVQTRTGTRPIVLMPGHLGMFVVLGASDEQLPVFLEMAREKYDEALRPQSPLPYTLDAEGEVVPLQVPEGHPAWQAIRGAESKLAAHTYRSQTEHLRAVRFRDEAVSELMHVRAPDGTEHTMTPWTDGVPTLLPRAHFVCLVTMNGEVFRVAWEDIAAHVHLTPAPGFDPPRYRVEDHPSAEIMNRLRELAR